MGIPKTIEWIGGVDGYVQLIDQTLLPNELRLIQCHDVGCMWEAIKVLRVRGAPAIGVAAAMGLVLGIRHAVGSEADFFATLAKQKAYLASARPTAVNLFWGLERMERYAESWRGQATPAIIFGLLEEAKKIRDEDAACCQAIGRHGASLIPDGAGVLTHCNAGSLATAEYGTALAVLYAAHQEGRRFCVYADETRPLLQGARLTAWELSQTGIDVTVICDNMAGQVMKEGKVDCVVVGADRIAANGDTANKIGTYSVAVLANAHRIPFYVAAPVNTFDLNCASGQQIPIEQRHADEIRSGLGRQTVPDGANVYNPAFDVTPAELINAIITDRGIISPVNQEQIVRVVHSVPK